MRCSTHGRRPWHPAVPATDCRSTVRATDTIALTIPASLRFVGVASLVTAGVAGRLGYSIERIDDLQLALSSVLAAGTEEEDLAVEFEASDERLILRVGPLHAGAGEDAGLLRIVRPLVDDVGSELSTDGEWLVLSLRAALS